MVPHVQLLSRLLVLEARSEPVSLGLPAPPPQPRNRGMEEAAARSLRVTLRFFDGCFPCLVWSSYGQGLC